MASGHKTLREIFDEACELSGDARRAYLEQACGSDDALRASVEELLRSEAEAGGFLANPTRTANAAVLPLMEREGDRIGRYKLLQKIGEGGCGLVYMAEETEPVRRRVALKVLKLGMDTRSVIARFEAERQALAMMDHANIARVLDAGATEAGRPYFVMELVRGIKITDYCEQNELSTTARLRLFVQVCQAVQHAHQKGIIHRDLKPSNILVTSDDGVPLPKVIDFGIAKATADIQLTDKTLFTRFEMFIGTPAYMSPEQAEFNASDIDTRTDIYALGVLLYELLTGQTPFDGTELSKSGLEAIRKIIREKEPARPSTRLSQTLETADAARLEPAPSGGPGPGEDAGVSARRRQRIQETITLLRGDLDWIVLKAMEKDRTRRYDTANGLAMDIQRHLDNEPILARPPSAVYRFQRMVRRNRLAFAAAAAVLVARVVGISGVMLVQYRANQDYRQRLYVSEINRAGLAWRSGQSTGLRESLERCPAGLRGWEWRFLQQQADRWEATAVLAESGPRFAGFAVAVESHLLAVAVSGQIRIRELPDGRWLHSIPFGVRYDNFSAVSPRGERLATADPFNYIDIWNMRTGERVTQITDCAASGKFSWTADGRFLASGCGDGMIRFWDAASGQVSRTLPGPQDMSFVAVSPDDKTLAVVSGGDRVLLLDSATGAVKQTLRTPVGHFKELKFSPDSRKLATCNSDLAGSGRDNRVWDLAAGEEGSLDLLIGANASAYDFSPDTRQILIADHKGMIRIWDLERRTEIDRFWAHAGSALSVQWLPDGRVLSSGDDGTKVWRARHPEIIQFKVPRSSLRTVAFSPNSRLLAAAGTSHEVSVLDLADGQREKIYKGNLSFHQLAVAFRPDGMIASGGQDSVQLWDPATLETKWKHQLAPAPTAFWIAFSPDGRRMYVDSQEDWLTVLDANTGERIKSIDGLGSTLDGLAVSPDGRLLALCQKVGQEKLTVRSAEDLRELWQVPSFTERCAAFSPDGQWITTGDRDGAISLYQTATQGRVRRKLHGHSASVTGVSFHPDGSRLASSSRDGQVKVWDWKAEIELLTLPLPDGIGAWHVAWSPDGSMIAAAGADGIVSLWRVK